jgi:hypothetical protein
MPEIKKAGLSSKANSPKSKPAVGNTPNAKTPAVGKTPTAKTPTAKAGTPAKATATPERKVLVPYSGMSHQKRFITLACFIPAIFGCDQKAATRTYSPQEGYPFSATAIEKLKGEKNKDVLTIIEGAMKKKFPDAQYRLSCKDSEYDGYVAIIMEFLEPKPAKAEATEKPAKPVAKVTPVAEKKPKPVAKPGTKPAPVVVAKKAKPVAKPGSKS